MLHFPKNFKWGTATASYQIEGGWNEDGKCESIWDRFCKVPGAIVDGSNGDVACDSYHQVDRDIEMLSELGVHFYRFSISWPRLLNGPNVNKSGLEYYNRLIDGLLAKNIEPVVTMFHWDLPQAIEDKGGWLNKEIVGDFENYSRVCFQSFGDRVKTWITLNEPWVIGFLGYNGNQALEGLHAPGVTEKPGVYPYLAAHHLLLAHARAYHIYVKEFKAKQNGRVGITLNSQYCIPKTPADEEAADRCMQFDFGWFAHPIFKGDYPDVMKSNVPNTRFPAFTQDEIKTILGSVDFLGLNYYTSFYIEDDSKNSSHQEESFSNDKKVKISYDPSWPGSGSKWLKVYPEGLRKKLNWVKKEYGDIEILITENGVSDNTGTLEDSPRIEYLKGHFKAILNAINDGCNVVGYTAWSLMDNFEWAEGYQEKFGLYQVDFNDSKRTRMPKASAKYFAQIIKDNGLKA